MASTTHLFTELGDLADGFGPHASGIRDPDALVTDLDGGAELHLVRQLSLLVWRLPFAGAPL